MPTMTVLVTGTDRDAPAMIEAARVFPRAVRLGCDRIRVEQAGGARVAEFPIATVERFFRYYRITPQPDRVARPGIDYEARRPVFPGWTRKES